MIRSFLTVSNGLLLTITDRTEIDQVHPKPLPSKAGAEDVELSVQQRRNADLVAKLIDKADEECPAFIFNEAPHETNAKSLWFLHGIEYPEDYRDL
ncbi:hypothetical protein [Pseudomonas azotoformans]|uniref:Uncharacterized protein n=1 Tax=Pseudomonas azotoformans TaxID=47878 RepID=A0A127I6T5_PSEAZ|nr:hypothetical protein [Pseudomonas azotoformans]AMN82559.1 hypothetical protein AYR47_31530 [Pseudomonas azotoformans]